MLTQLRSSDLYSRVRNHEVLGQFVRYAMVGVLNVAVFFSIFNVLLALELPALAAYPIGFAFTSLVSFLLNKTWAFNDERRHAVFRQYLLFVSLTLVGLGLNTAAFSLFLIPLRQYGTAGKNLAALCPLPLSVAWNFTSYRLWTFRPGVGGSSAA